MLSADLEAESSYLRRVSACPVASGIRLQEEHVQTPSKTSQDIRGTHIIASVLQLVVTPSIMRMVMSSSTDWSEDFTHHL